MPEYWSSPQWWRVQAYEAVGDIHESFRDDADVPVTAAEWDTLVVLDGCRADVFEEVGAPDEFDAYSRRRSVGSWTGEWVDATWTGTYGDVVYTTANPFVALRAGGRFHATVEAYEDGFDPDLGTVPPDALVDAALDAFERYPAKRHVVHVMQPHHPFVATADAEEWSSWDLRDTARDEAMATGLVDSPWDRLAVGDLDRGDVWAAYRATLELALDELERLLDAHDGRVVVTADHGNLAGERLWPLPVRGYGHPRRVRHDALVEVPWAVREDSRRAVTDDGVRRTETTRDDVAARLAALGYRA